MKRLGKLPARPGAISLQFKTYATKLPAAPAAAGHDTLVKDWGMLGNDDYGDCVFAGAGHETMLWNAEANKTVTVGRAQALAAYTAVTGFNPMDPNTDQGTDMEVAAKWRRKTGIPDTTNTRHTIGAYVNVAKGNASEVKDAIYYFGAVGIGWELPKSAMDQFDAGKPWTIVKGSTIDGGHYTPAIAYDADYLYIVTWGQLQKVAWDFFKKYNDESIGYLSKEMIGSSGHSLEGFDLATLTADLAKV
jgi:hypothetical protein